MPTSRLTKVQILITTRQPTTAPIGNSSCRKGIRAIGIPGSPGAAGPDRTSGSGLDGARTGGTERRSGQSRQPGCNRPGGAGSCRRGYDRPGPLEEVGDRLRHPVDDAERRRRRITGGRGGSNHPPKEERDRLRYPVGGGDCFLRGGAANQLLVKNSATNYDTKWGNPAPLVSQGSNVGAGSFQISTINTILSPDTLFVNLFLKNTTTGDTHFITIDFAGCNNLEQQGTTATSSPNGAWC